MQRSTRRAGRRIEQRLTYLLDRFLSAPPLLQIAAICLFAFALALGFGVAALLVVRGDSELETLPRAFWWALTRMFDGGTVAADASTPRRVVGTVVTVFGLVVVAVLTGAFASSFTERISALRRGTSAVFEHGHILIVGYSSRALVVVRELARTNRRWTVVLLSGRSRDAIEAELADALEGLPALRVVVRTGDPTTALALRRVAAPRARAVLVTPDRNALGVAQSDRWTMCVLLALRKAAPHREIPTIVEVADAAGEELARLACAAHSVLAVVRARETMARLLVQVVRQQGVYEVIRRILSLVSASLRLFPPADVVGWTFDRAHRSLANGVLVGLFREGRALLAPGGDAAITPDDALLVLANDAAPPAFTATTTQSAAEERPLAVRDAGDAMPRSQRLHDILLVGFKPELGEMITALKEHVAPGSKLTVIVTGDDFEAARQAVSGAVTERLLVDVVACDAGETTELEALLGRQHDVALLLEKEVSADRMDDADTTQLATLLLARRAQAEQQRRMRTVVELHSPATRRLVPAEERASDFVISREVLGMLLAQHLVAACTEPRFAPRHSSALRELFDGRGVEVQLRAWARYAAPQGVTTFARVAAAARARGEVAIGFVTHEKHMTLAPLPSTQLHDGDGPRIIVLGYSGTDTQPDA